MGHSGWTGLVNGHLDKIHFVGQTTTTCSSFLGNHLNYLPKNSYDGAMDVVLQIS